MNDMPIALTNELYTRLKKRFSRELAIWDLQKEDHLVAIATFGFGTTGVPAVEEISLMNVNDAWIPYETMDDRALISDMIANRRRFSKGLRYNLASSVPLACMVASDTAPTPTAMYIVPAEAPESYMKALQELQDASKLAQWVWHADANRPALPNLGKEHNTA